MDEQISTTYDKELNAHLATINPPYGAVDITVHVDKFESLPRLHELFLYNFDIDSNAIEFAFGEKLQELDSRKIVTYSTDPARHVPPFRIQITHQLDNVKLENYAFTISYKLQY